MNGSDNRHERGIPVTASPLVPETRADGPDSGEYRNYRTALDRFVAGYNKSVIQTSITTSSYGILMDRVEKIRSGLESIVAAFEEITATSKSTEKNTSAIDGLMHEVLSSHEGMGTSLETRANEIKDVVKDAKGISGLFQDLLTKSDTIREMTGSIQDVADRTNILAINASIEAARAGSVGKGFRIIANEVRNLAGRTGEFATDISSIVEEFGRAVGAVRSRMDGFLALIEAFQQDISRIRDNFQENATSVNRTGDALGEISLAVSEQSAALTEGLGSLQNMSAFLGDSRAIFAALAETHGYLDRILSGESGGES